MNEELPWKEFLKRGYRCMYCDADPKRLKVSDPRVTRKYGIIMKRRTRHCLACGAKYSTYEINHKDLAQLAEATDVLQHMKEYLIKEIKSYKRDK